MMIADDLGDERIGSDTIGLISDLNQPSVEVAVPRLIFQAVFGSPDRAVSLADDVLQAATTTASIGARLQGIRAAALALYRCGDTTRARQFGADGYELAAQHAIWSDCTAFATMICTFAMDAGELAVADSWYDRAAEAMRLSGGPDRGYQLMGVSINLALLRGDPHAAFEGLAELERVYPEMCHNRMGYTFLALRMAIQMALGQQPDPGGVQALLDGHRERRGLGFQDFVADTLVGALRALGKHDQASLVNTEYVTVYRRDRFPLPPYRKHLKA